jgi:hypothetical protein
MNDQTAGMPPVHRAPLDPWPSQSPLVPESDEPLGGQEAGPDEPLEERKTPARTPSAGTPGSEGRPSKR